MRLKIRHQTRYAYGAEPARSAIQIVRKTPRSDASQFVRRWRIEVDADCRLDKGEDAFGNITHMFSVEGPIAAMSVTTEGEIETTDRNGMVSDTVERFPLSFWKRPSALTEPTLDIRRFARDISMSEGGDPFAAAHAINTTINREFTFLLGETDATTPASKVLSQKKGVCQDFAHLFIAAMRSLDRPARYVSGYYLLDDRDMQEAGHAWAEVHLPGYGWVSFDPANNVCGTERHVRLAIGPDYLDAAPIRGSRTGGTGEELTVAIEVSVAKPISDAPTYDTAQMMQQQ
jgi:transglutaminase-like putative cysteine protease